MPQTLRENLQRSIRAIRAFAKQEAVARSSVPAEIQIECCLSVCMHVLSLRDVHDQWSAPGSLVKGSFQVPHPPIGCRHDHFIPLRPTGVLTKGRSDAVMPSIRLLSCFKEMIGSDF
jgi:hypothetical protein